MTSLNRTAFLVAANLLIFDATAQGEPPPHPLRVRQLAATCLTCHPVKSDPKAAIPTLNGRPEEFLDATLKAYRSGRRSGNLMNQIAAGLSISQIETLSTHFTKQP